jgi:hypothetical protein
MQFLAIRIDDLDGLGDGARRNKDGIEIQGIGGKRNSGIPTGDKRIFPAGNDDKDNEYDKQQLVHVAKTNVDRLLPPG